MTDVLGTWSEFNVAMLGATAALAGLVIVAASVNVEKIIASPVLVARLAAALATLLLTLIVSGFGLFPELEPFWYGVAVLCVSLPVLVIQGYASYRVQVDPERHGRQRILKSIPGFICLACYVASGVMLLVGHPAGLAFTAIAALTAIAAAILISWIVLIEVLR